MFRPAAAITEEQRYKIQSINQQLTDVLTFSVDISVDQSCLRVDLVNKHVSDGGILGVAPLVSLK